MTTRKITTLAVGLIMTGLVSATAYAGGRSGDTYKPTVSVPGNTGVAYSGSRMMTMMASLDPVQRQQMVTECEHMMGDDTPATAQK